MTAAEIEQTKLTATFLNGVAIAIIAVGWFAPVAAFVGGTYQQAPLILSAQGIGCLAFGFALHAVGRWVLRRLSP